MSDSHLFLWSQRGASPSPTAPAWSTAFLVCARLDEKRVGEQIKLWAKCMSIRVKIIPTSGHRDQVQGEEGR